MTVQATPTAESATSWSRALVAAAGIVMVLAFGAMLGGEPGRFAATGLTYVPIIGLGLLLQLSQYPTARALSWIWLWSILVGFALLALGLVFLTLVPPGTAPTPEAAQAIVAPMLAMLVILGAGALLGITRMWAPLATRLGAHVDRESTPHAEGTIGVLVLSALAIAPLGVLGGRAPLIELINGIEGSIQALSNAEQLLMQIYSLIWVGVLVLCCAGWPTRLSVRGALVRLGVGPLAQRDALPLLGMTALSVAVGVALDFLNRVVFTSLGLPMTDPTVVTRLVPVATTIYGAIVVAVCAGVTEELMFRGLLQPRLGWLLANAAFAAGHAFQYGLDGLVAVFVLGAILAFVRARWNTTASISVHVGYDAVLFLLASFGF